MKKKQLEKLHKVLLLLNESVQAEKDQRKDSADVIMEMQFLEVQAINLLGQIYIEESAKKELERLKKEELKYKEE